MWFFFGRCRFKNVDASTVDANTVHGTVNVTVDAGIVEGTVEYLLILVRQMLMAIKI